MRKFCRLACLLLVLLLLVSLPQTTGRAQAANYHPLMTLGRGTIEGMDGNPARSYLPINAMTGVWLYDKNSLQDVRHFPDLYRAKFSPNGKLIAAGRGSQIVVMDAASFVVLTEFDASYVNYLSLYWSPDSTQFAAIWADGLVQVWDVVAKQPGLVFYQSKTSALSLAWSPDSKYFLAIDTDGETAVIWLVAEQRRVAAFVLNQLKNQQSIGKLLWSADGRTILRAVNNFSESIAIFQVWNRLTGQLLQEEQTPLAFGLEYSPDQSKILISSENTFQVLDAQTFKPIKSLEAPMQYLRMRWSPNGRILAGFGSEDRFSKDSLLNFWDANTGNLLSTIRIPFIAIELVWSDDNHYVSTLTKDQLIQKWEVYTGKLIAEQTGHNTIWGSAPVWNTDGNSIFAFDSQGRVHLWNVAQKQVQTTLPKVYDLTFIAPQPHGNLLAEASYIPEGTYQAANPTVYLWNLETRQLIASKLLNDTSRITALEWQQDGSRLLIGTQNGKIEYWTFTNQFALLFESAEKVLGHPAYMWEAHLSPDGKKLLTLNDACCVGGIPIIWDGVTGKLIRQPDIDTTRRGRAFAWSTDATTLYLANWRTGGDYCGDGGCGDPLQDPDRFKVKLFSICCTSTSADDKSVVRLVTLEGNTDFVRSVDWSLDRSQIATISELQTLRVWDVKTGKLQYTVPDVDQMAWNRDGTKLAVWQDHQPVRILDAKAGSTIATLNNAGVVAWNPRNDQIAVVVDGVLQIWGT